MIERVKTTPRAEPTLVVVIVTWNSRRWYRECLLSLLATHQAAENIIVVDNSSDDGTPEMIEKEFPTVHLHRHTRNLGAAAGLNAGARLALDAGADYVFFLNPDTRVLPGWREGILAAARENPDYGIISSLQYDYSGSELDASFKQGYSEGATADSPAIVETETVIGAGMLVTRRTFEKIGGFDTLYFVYGEEDDFCRRARYHGFKVGITSRAAICHWHTARQRGENGHLTGRRLRNQFLYELKDPGFSTGRCVAMFAKYYLLRRMRQAVQRRDWKYAGRIIWANMRLLCHAPRILVTRNREREGRCHL